MPPATPLVVKDSPLKTGLSGAVMLLMFGGAFGFYVSEGKGPLTWDFALFLAIPGLLALLSAARIWRSFHPRLRLTVAPEGIWTPDSGPMTWADLTSYYALFASSKYGLNTYLLLYTTSGQEIEVAFDSADADWRTVQLAFNQFNTNAALRFDGVQRSKLKRPA